MSRRLQKPVVFVLALMPGLWLAYRAFDGRLGVNPVEDLLLTTGIWALRLLLVTLAITPIRRLTGWNRVIRFRRMLGLFSFFYAAVHVTIYLVLDQGLEFQFILADVAKRRFITAGMVAFLLMVPLALTSTRGWIRRLGPRWQRLHRLVYICAIAASLHFIWKVKVVIGAPVYYAAAVALFLAFRFIWTLRTHSVVRRQPVQA